MYDSIGNGLDQQIIDFKSNHADLKIVFINTQGTDTMLCRKLVSSASILPAYANYFFHNYFSPFFFLIIIRSTNIKIAGRIKITMTTEAIAPYAIIIQVCDITF